MISKETFLDKLGKKSGDVTAVVYDSPTNRDFFTEKVNEILETYKEGDYDGFEAASLADHPKAALLAAYCLLIRFLLGKEVTEDNCVERLQEYFGESVSFLIAHKGEETDYILIW